MDFPPDGWFDKTRTEEPKTLYEIIPALEPLTREGYTYTTSEERRLIAQALQAIIRTQIKDGEEMRRRLADLENRFYDRD